MQFAFKQYVHYTLDYLVRVTTVPLGEYFTTIFRVPTIKLTHVNYCGMIHTLTQYLEHLWVPSQYLHDPYLQVTITIVHKYTIFNEGNIGITQCVLIREVSWFREFAGLHCVKREYLSSWNTSSILHYSVI